MALFYRFEFRRQMSAMVVFVWGHVSRRGGNILHYGCRWAFMHDSLAGDVCRRSQTPIDVMYSSDSCQPNVLFQHHPRVYACRNLLRVHETRAINARFRSASKLVGTVRKVSRAGSMQLTGVRPSVCPNMGPQQQIRCCRFAAVGPALSSSGLWRPKAGSAM